MDMISSCPHYLIALQWCSFIKIYERSLVTESAGETYMSRANSYIPVTGQEKDLTVGDLGSVMSKSHKPWSFRALAY